VKGGRTKIRRKLIPETRCSVAEGAIGEFERRDGRIKECEVRGRACRPWWLRE
jgi:hypothetical protein